jgi:hypothetical protein
MSLNTFISPKGKSNVTHVGDNQQIHFAIVQTAYNFAAFLKKL